VALGTATVRKELERRQKSRGTRSQRDALDRALADLAAFYRDVLAVQFGAAVEPVHADQSDSVVVVARSSRPEATVARLEAVLACRTDLDANVAPLLAVEALALRLRTGSPPGG
jgi:DNA polymerase-3 subunit delta'